MVFTTTIIMRFVCLYEIKVYILLQRDSHVQKKMLALAFVSHLQPSLTLSLVVARKVSSVLQQSFLCSFSFI